MKKTNLLKMILIISIVILLTLIAFAGIYVKKANKYENIVPKLKLGMDLSSKKVLTIKPATGTKTLIYDENGEKVDSIPEGADESKYTKETIEINPQDVLTQANFEKAKSVIEKRLDAMRAEGYTIKLNNSTGEIIIEIPNNDNAQKYANVLTATGKFEMVAQETKEGLLSNEDFKKAKVSYYNEEDGTSVYLTMELTKKGAKKLRDISKTYASKIEQVTTKDETTGEDKTEEKNVGKKTILRIDWPGNTGALELSDVVNQSFSEEMTNGTLQLRIGKAAKKDKIQKYYDQAFEIASALNSGKIDVEYKQSANEILDTEVTKNQMIMAVGIMIAVFFAILLIMIIKFKILGCLGAIANIGMLSMTLIFIRIAKVVISINFIPSIVALAIVNTVITIILMRQIKSSENVKNAFWKGILKSADIVAIMTVIAVVFIFMYNELIVSSGMIIFWGIISIVITNLLITRPLLIEGSKN